jgi:hypothetical protein
MGPSSALFRAPPPKPKVTTSEYKKSTRVTRGLRICIGHADTAASNHFHVHNPIQSSPSNSQAFEWGHPVPCLEPPLKPKFAANEDM